MCQNASGLGRCGGGGSRWRGELTSTPAAAVMQLITLALEGEQTWIACSRRERVPAIRWAKPR